MPTVVALFKDFEVAESAVESLAASGFAREKISLTVGDPHGKYAKRFGAPGQDQESDISPTLSGALTGAAVGGGVGLGAGILALAIPGIGPVIALGAMGLALAGSAAGGIIGALSNLGVPEHEAVRYEEGLRRGGTLLTVEAADDAHADEARAILANRGAADIHTRADE